MDVICQAKSGMGKTAVFVLAVLQQLEPVPGEIGALILCHTRELAYQICHEFDRFAAYLPGVTVSVIFGGVNIKQQREQLKEKPPSVIVATPRAVQGTRQGGRHLAEAVWALHPRRVRQDARAAGHARRCAGDFQDDPP